MKTRIKVVRAFSKPVVAGFEGQIRDLTLKILDQALVIGGFDATREIARQLPMRLLGRILGTPEADLAWLVKKGDALIANSDPDFTDHVLDQMNTDEFRLMPSLISPKRHVRKARACHARSRCALRLMAWS